MAPRSTRIFTRHAGDDIPVPVRCCARRACAELVDGRSGGFCPTHAKEVLGRSKADREYLDGLRRRQAERLRTRGA